MSTTKPTTVDRSEPNVTFVVASHVRAAMGSTHLIVKGLPLTIADRISDDLTLARLGRMARMTEEV